MANDQRIIEALTEAGIDYDTEAYDPAKSFRDNGIDSLDVMGLFLTIQEKYGVKFSEAEVPNIKTPLDITIALDRMLK